LDNTITTADAAAAQEGLPAEPLQAPRNAQIDEALAFEPDSCALSDAVARCDQISACAGQIGREAIESMVSCLGDPDPMVRWEASRALAESAHHLQRPAHLGDVLTMGATDAMSLSELLGVMREGLMSPDATLRASYTEALARWPHPVAVELLEQSLQDDSADVRAAAARGLGQLGALESTERLIAALEDASLWVRRSAADALGAIADRRATPALISMAQEGPALTRTAALAALGHLPGREARATLEAMLTDENGEIRWHAARSLETAGTSTTLSALKGLVGDNYSLFGRTVSEVALAAMDAIGQREQGVWHALRVAVLRLIARFRRR
jgi:HEAT repeat protein